MTEPPATKRSAAKATKAAQVVKAAVPPTRGSDPLSVARTAVAALGTVRRLRHRATAMTEAPGAAVRAVAERARQAAETVSAVDAPGRPPIQVGVDAAVPVHVAWREFRRLEWLPEGIDQVVAIDRVRGKRIRGRILRGPRWAAEILDDRDEESFAWQSIRGSDCAGLITFHPLSDRLTRIELSLDIRPADARQTLMVAARVADHRAAMSLRRFKARLELINPDLYRERERPAA
ncbi:MAG TPA: hypothetical protein VFN55_01605 [Solirubrobacteraceae bacterium]|nr:hypothetical protein [Solirubrobacteraceae bacterium]